MLVYRWSVHPCIMKSTHGEGEAMWGHELIVSVVVVTILLLQRSK